MKTLLLGATALLLVSGSGAFAQRYDSRDYDGPRYERDYYGPRYERDYDRGDYDRGSRRGDTRWREGGVLPYEYRAGGKYVHYDWRGSGLQRPPRDFAWMRIGDQFVLANQRTGYILDVEYARNRPAVWTRGGVVPYELRVGGKNVEYDWRGAGLRRPPEGHVWMRLGDAYVLADQHSGEIADVRPAGRYR